jgi:hypothetical protein
MRIVKKVLAILGGVGVALSQGAGASAADLDGCKRTIAGLSMPNLQAEAKCACEAALQEGTIEALEEWLRRYRDVDVDSACTALALEALVSFSPDNDAYDDRPERPNGGYGG